MSTELPFSRPVKVDTLPRDGLEQTITANESERAALANENHLPGIAELKATLTIKRSGKGVRVRGSVHAEATQTCVVSLDPFPVTIDEPVDVRYAPQREERSPGKAKAEPELILIEQDDEPDPIVDGKIDLGALAAEFFALGLDPYPRKPGVEFEPPPTDGDDDSPFNALARIKKEEG